MKYTMVRLFLIAASSCVVWASGNSADAGWGLLHGGSGGSSGGYGSYGAGYGSSGGAVASYGSSGYGSSGGVVASYGSSGGYAATSYGSSGGSSGGGPGPLRRLAAHIHDHIAAKHARRAAYGSSGGSSGSYVASYGSSGGSSGSYTSSYGSSGGYGSSGYSTSYGSSGGGYGSSGYSTSYGSSGGGYGSSGYSTSYGSTGSVMSYGSTGSTYSTGYIGVTNQSPAAVADLASDDSDAIYLNVAVPATAKVYVNDMPTTSTGVSRQYVSRGLESGKNYKFELRAEVVGADGKLVKETKLVTLAAGQKDTVRFASLESTHVQTVVTLNVPAEAKVVLAGNETNATGETRTFRTSQLKAGDSWDDYVVEVHHNGKVKRESLRLLAGDDVALTFNFEDDKSLVASR